MMPPHDVDGGIVAIEQGSGSNACGSCIGDIECNGGEAIAPASSRISACTTLWYEGHVAWNEFYKSPPGGDRRHSREGLRQFHVFDQTELAKRKRNGTAWSTNAACTTRSA